MAVQKNPTWTRDELVLALDVYFSLEITHVTAKHPEIIALSELLNDLPIHSPSHKNNKFRNPPGIHMKLRNFVRFDNRYSRRGLQRGGKLEEEIWKEFAENRVRLHTTAQAIKENYRALPISENRIGEEDIEEVFSEGKILSRIHHLRERNPTAVKRKKEKVRRETGKLECEVCSFDFARQYGKLGYGYAECHHTLPLASLKGESATKLSDLAIVCANCHRMLHRSNSWLSIAEL